MVKNLNKSKFSNKDQADDDSHLIKNSPKTKKQPQKTSEEDVDAENIGQMIGQYSVSAKKRRSNNDVGFKDTKKMLLDTMGQQMIARKHGNEALLSSLSSVVETFEADLLVLSENEKQLQHMAAAVLKSAHQNIEALKEKTKAIKGIQAQFENHCQELESEEKAVNIKMADELEEHINKLQQKLVNDMKKKQMENLRKSLFHAINDI